MREVVYIEIFVLEVIKIYCFICAKSFKHMSHTGLREYF